MNPAMLQATVKTPIGCVIVRQQQEWLVCLDIDAAGAVDAPPSTPLLREAARQIEAYFDGTLRTFDLPLAPLLSPRGEDHRAAIVGIPYGDASSYGALARQIGSSPRAIGQACRRNPLPLLVPCHRVVAAGGKIGQYSGGEGIATKLWLLQHEARRV